MHYNLNLIRTLAKSHKWQSLYARGKEMSGLRLFENQTDLSDVQFMFLQWLELYHILETDLAMERPYLSKEILKDDFRTDAYLTIRKDSIKELNNKKAKKKVDSNSPAVIFRKG